KRSRDAQQPAVERERQRSREEERIEQQRELKPPAQLKEMRQSPEERKTEQPQKPVVPQPEIRKRGVQQRQPKAQEEEEEGVQEDRTPGILPEKSWGRDKR
ncbi:MAG: hypothetical protein OEW04_13955, partial [Nitrospirota bacterium]|nr:hypothetical protein [Nitrospirota bacterium]